MRTILIATDFSDASRNASYYGLALAKEIGANVCLFNSYKLPTPAAGLGVTVSGYDAKMQTDAKLLEEAVKLDLGNKNIQIISDEGNAGEAIIKLANEKKFDFIITGMKGVGKSLKKIFGSTATSLAKHTNLPLIIVPEDAIYTTPEKVVFASDTPVTDYAVPAQLTSILTLFRSKLYVVKVVKDGNEERVAIPGSVQKEKVSAAGNEVSFQVKEGTDIRHALSDFIREQYADMLVMMPHKHDWTERLFKKSETANMIFHTKIPLLILPDIPST
ncbi:MAG: universal stress protein [Ginsengibacter sp.]